MTALSENRYTKHRDGLITAHQVKGSSTIYKGSLICADSAGYALAGADTANYTFLGVALEDADNSAGSDGDMSVRVQTIGVFSFAKSGAITIADTGTSLYIADDQTLALAATTTNDVLVGRLEALDGSDIWVRLKL